MNKLPQQLLKIMLTTHTKMIFSVKDNCFSYFIITFASK